MQALVKVVLMRLSQVGEYEGSTDQKEHTLHRPALQHDRRQATALRADIFRIYDKPDISISNHTAICKILDISIKRTSEALRSNRLMTTNTISGTPDQTSVEYSFVHGIGVIQSLF